MSSSGRTLLVANDLLPWLIDIDVLGATPAAQLNWNDNSGLSGSAIYLSSLTSTGAQNAEASWDVVLAAGTWTYEQMHIASGGAGIYSVRLDNVEKGTIDGYSAGAVFNLRSPIAGIVVPSAAKRRLTVRMTGKNALSSAYYGQLQHIQLRRTA